MAPNYYLVRVECTELTTIGFYVLFLPVASRKIHPLHIAVVKHRSDDDIGPRRISNFAYLYAVRNLKKDIVYMTPETQIKGQYSLISASGGLDKQNRQNFNSMSMAKYV